MKTDPAELICWAALGAIATLILANVVRVIFCG